MIKWAVLASVRLNLSKEQEGKECLVSKLLRWLTASIIIGRISNLSIKSRESFHENRMEIRTLDSLIRYMIGDEDSGGIEGCEVNETLGAMILYLQQIVRRSTSDSASSVLLSLSLLLLNSCSESGTKCPLSFLKDYVFLTRIIIFFKRATLFGGGQLLNSCCCHFSLYCY